MGLFSRLLGSKKFGSIEAMYNVDPQLFRVASEAISSGRYKIKSRSANGDFVLMTVGDRSLIVSGQFQPSLYGGAPDMIVNGIFPDDT